MTKSSKQNPNIAVMTADMMFKDLGYEKINDCTYYRIESDILGREVFISIDNSFGVMKYTKDEELGVGVATRMSSEELKAAYKKIEEFEK